MAFSKAIIFGNLTSDPELKQTNSGKVVTSFTVAVNRYGSEEADFIPCVAWEKTAEFVTKYFRKGDGIIVTDGRIQSRSWNDAAGNRRTAVEVVALGVDFGGKKQDGQKKQEQTPVSSDVHFEEMSSDEDLPF